MKGILTHLREKFASTALPANRFSRPKSNGNNVIVVDDENAVCQIVQRMLSDEQYQVQTSQSVPDALRAIEQSLLPPTFVNAQVLIPTLNGAGELSPEMRDLLNDIKQARNTSVQVKSKSLADARRHFDILKAALSKEPYYSEISWREGEGGSIDALQIIMLLMIYYPTFAASADGEPSNAYGHKERCLEAYLGYSDGEPEELEKWISTLPVLIRLFDALQIRLPEHYSGSFGKIEEVKIFDEKRLQKGEKKYRSTAPKSQFLGSPMKYQYPTGWLFPIFAAFRHLVGPSKDGSTVAWRRDPFAFWEKHGPELVRRYEPHIRDAGYETKRIATSYICYQAPESGDQRLLQGRAAQGTRNKRLK